MSKSRIYVVSSEEKEVRLVEAGTAAQAIHHVIANRYNAKPATAKDVAELVGGGMRVEQAKAKQTELVGP